MGLVAQIYNGGGISAGASAAATVVGNTDIRTLVQRTLNIALSFLGLVAVVVIVIAGIYLVVGMGSDESRDKAKKTILYVFVGLILILLATALVNLVTQDIVNNVTN